MIFSLSSVRKRTKGMFVLFLEVVKGIATCEASRILHLSFNSGIPKISNIMIHTHEPITRVFSRRLIFIIVSNVHMLGQVVYQINEFTTRQRHQTRRPIQICDLIQPLYPRLFWKITFKSSQIYLRFLLFCPFAHSSLYPEMRLSTH